MYIPPAFRIDDPATLHAFMRQYSFATLITGGAEPFVTHLPLLLDATKGPHGTFIGHVARANPHWRLDHASVGSVAVFHGPHGYVSPAWYDVPVVPTWNYAVVHASGRLRVMEEAADVAGVLERMMAVYEPGGETGRGKAMPREAREKLIAAVVAFEMPIERLEGKFKLSQNRSREDQARAIEGLEASGDADSAALARFARQTLEIHEPK